METAKVAQGPAAGMTAGPRPPRKSATGGLFTSPLVRAALRQSLVSLRPDIQWKNPVMFVVEIGAVLTLVFIIQMAMGAAHSQAPLTYFIALDVWLFLTVVFANFATAIAEERGKAQADALRRARRDTVAYRLRPDGSRETVSSIKLQRGDLVVVRSGEVIPSDGEIIKGTASVDESAITGESAPVIRDAGGDRSGVTGGTTVLSDEITVRVSAQAGETFLDRMIALVEGAVRQRTPNEIALTLVLSAFTLIFLIVVVPLWPMALNAEQYMTSYLGLSEPLHSLGTDIPTLVALLVCLIPTTIGALLAAIGIAGMDRALRANIIAKSGKAVEVAGDIDTVVLDKTGTITIGNRRATGFMPVGAYDEGELKRLAALASSGDQTPEGKSIVTVVSSLVPYAALGVPHDAKVIPFSAQSRMSGIDMPDGSDPTKLIEVIEIGKQLLMTRGALTTFSIANDVAKYFAIVPALFAGTLPWLGAMDVMHLHSPTSAILSAVIFNALIIPLLIPIALKGVKYRALGADALLRRNLLVWGLGGVIVLS
jgi:K+-transporting ATPase ATPase B chain